MVRAVSSEDSYVTFRGVSVAVAASNYRLVGTYTYLRTDATSHVVRHPENVTEVLAGHYGLSASPVGIHIGLRTAVICHCQAPPGHLTAGGRRRQEEEEVRVEEVDEGRIEPSAVW